MWIDWKPIRLNPNKFGTTFQSDLIWDFQFESLLFRIELVWNGLQTWLGLNKIGGLALSQTDFQSIHI